MTNTTETPIVNKISYEMFKETTDILEKKYEIDEDTVMAIMIDLTKTLHLQPTETPAEVLQRMFEELGKMLE